MAVVGRCLVYPPTFSSPRLRRRPLHLLLRASGADCASDETLLLMSQQKKCSMSMSKMTSIKFGFRPGMDHIPLCCCTVCSAPAIFQSSKLLKIGTFVDKISDLLQIKMEFMYNHQKEMLINFSRILVAANLLMFIVPSDALAETCESDNAFYNMPLLFAIAMIGATVGGLLARQRRGELKRLNDQLRQINAALRRQAKIESYAPNLSYAPVGRVSETEVIVDPRKEELITKLRTGKNFLRNQDSEKAFVEFKAALELAEGLGDHVEEKKAARGLGASLQRQGKYREAIKYHSKVLEMAKRSGEDSGSTEAYGAIADCYTELGDLEKAGKFYDKYIARLESD